MGGGGLEPAQAAADPRPAVDGQEIVGVRCQTCGRPSAFPDTRCRRCRGPVFAERYGPDGIVWASATVHLQVDHREPPFTLAYVDLEAGPRVLTLVKQGETVGPDARVRIVGEQEGDILVEVAGDE